MEKKSPYARSDSKASDWDRRLLWTTVKWRFCEWVYSLLAITAHRFMRCQCGGIKIYTENSMPKIRRMLWNQLHSVRVCTTYVYAHGSGGWWEGSSVAAAVHIKTHKGFYQPFQHQMNLNFSTYISQWHSKYSNQFFWRSIICSQRLFTFSIRLSIFRSIRFPEFFLFASNPFSLVFHLDNIKVYF